MSPNEPTGSLFETLEDTPAEDPQGYALVEGLAALAARHRVAEALAEEEYLLGVHVDESELAESAVVLAAQDEDDAAPAPGPAAVYSAGRVVVRVQITESGLVAIQEGGARGLSLRTPAGLVPLQPGVPVSLVGLSGLPDVLEGVDRRGTLLSLLRTLPDPPQG